MLLTMKTKHDVKPFPSFGSKDALKSIWKRVQVMADEFWHRWKTEYLHNLQYRRKWQGHAVDLKYGDLVLLIEDDSPRNEWPTGIIQRTFSSQDGKVRKAEVAVFKDNKRVTYVRPVTRLITLLETD